MTKINFKMYAAFRTEIYRKAREREEPLGKLEHWLADLHSIADTQTMNLRRELTNLYNSWYGSNGTYDRSARQ